MIRLATPKSDPRPTLLACYRAAADRVARLRDLQAEVAAIRRKLDVPVVGPRTLEDALALAWIAGRMIGEALNIARGEHADVDEELARALDAAGPLSTSEGTWTGRIDDEGQPHVALAEIRRGR